MLLLVLKNLMEIKGPYRRVNGFHLVQIKIQPLLGTRDFRKVLRDKLKIHKVLPQAFFFFFLSIEKVLSLS